MMKKWISICAIAVLMMACSSDDEDSNNNVADDNFDRKAMLENWADNIIVPAHEDLNSKLGTLVDEKDNFVDSPTEANLESLRNAWFEAYKVWQHVEMFNIGKAEEMQYLFQMNVYPTNIEDIENNIQDENFDIEFVNNQDAVGFPAVEYMIYGVGDSKADIVSYYSNNASQILNIFQV